MSWFLQFPKVRFVVFLIFAAGAVLLAGFLVYGMIGRWQQDVDTPDDPEPMTLQEAIDRSKKKSGFWDEIWVSLQDTEELAWDCSTIVHWSEEKSGAEWMDVVVTDPAQSIVIVVVLEDPLTCSELLASPPPLSGALSQLKGQDFKDADFEGRLSRYPQSATFLNLCTYCDPNNAVPALVLGAVCMISCLIFAGMTLRTALRARAEFRRQARDAAAERAKPAAPPSGVPLEDVFDFTAADLAENAAGRLSARQKARMRPESGLRELGLLLILEAFGLGIMVLGTMGVADMRRTGSYIVGGFFCFVGGPIFAVLGIMYRRSVHKGRIFKQCGRVTKKSRHLTDFSEYWAIIDKITFTLSVDQYHALGEGASYCFYYLRGIAWHRGRRKVVSVQPQPTE